MTYADTLGRVQLLSLTSGVRIGELARPGRAFSYGVFARTLARWAQAAAIPIPIPPHLFRHSCATIRAENGMETVALQRYMGWEDIKTALYYVHLSGRHVLDAARAARPAVPAGHVEDRV